MLRDMSENTEKSSFEAANGSSFNEDNERDHSDSEDLIHPPFWNGSYSVDQNVQGALQGVAVIGQRSNAVPKLRARHRGQFLNPDDPRRALVFHSRREAWKGRVSARLAQGRHDARGVNADQVGLKVDDKLATLQAIEVELRHSVLVSETAEGREGQTLLGDLLGIGLNCRLVRLSPQAVTLHLGRLNDRRLGQARHVEAKRPCRLRDIGVEGQIDFHAAHNALLPVYTYG